MQLKPKRWPSRLAVSVLLGLAVGCARPQGATTRGPEGDPASRIARIESGLLPAVQVVGEELRYTLEERMREHQVPAVSVAVFEGYELVWARAYGLADVDTGARASETTLFQAGSISKSVNALAVLTAAAEGTLALDEPINTQLRGWQLPENELTRATPVTLRQLLSHTAGTTVHGFPGYAAGEEVPSVQQVLDGEPPANTEAVRVDLAPGTSFRYSGGGTTITQLVLSERSGRPYPEVLDSLVLAPLGMAHSSYEQPLPASRRVHAAAGHDYDGHVIAGKRHLYPEMAAAGLWTTPSDLARFFAELALAREGRSSRISQAIALAMTTKVMDIGDGGDATGLGVFLTTRNGARLFGHGGDDEGFQANAVVSLDGGYGLVVMANSNNGFRIFSELERAVFAEYGWPGADPQVVRFAMAPEDRVRLVGRYLDGRLPFVVAEVDGKLVRRAVFGVAGELVPIAADAVIARDSGETLRPDASGGLQSTSGGQPARTFPRLADTVRHPLLELEADRLADAVAVWREQVRLDPQGAAEDERIANLLAYRMLGSDPARAIALLQLIAIVFPESSNAHDSLGEAYMITGDTQRAIEAYEQALATLDADPRIDADGKAASRARAEAALKQLRGLGSSGRGR